MSATILDTILTHKRREVASRKELYPVKLLEQSIYFNTPCVSLKKYLLRADLEGIIAEIKRKSPSKGYFKKTLSIERLSIGYMQAGASALSVLTDSEFFGGNSEDLTIARRFNFCPILRKDFIIDEYQIIEAKSMGADVILLIAAALTTDEIRTFSNAAHALQLEVLLEVHSEEELMRTLGAGNIDLVGVNNRDLRDFSVSIDRSLALAAKIGNQFTMISESGIHTAEDILVLRKAGFRGFLIGETFMSKSRPAKACADFIAELRARRE